MPSWLRGKLEFFSETGTEGGYWAFQDSRFQHGLDFDCGSRSCPTKFRKDTDGSYRVGGTGEPISEVHSSQYGLYVLKDGDGLRVYPPDDREGYGQPPTETCVLKFPEEQDPYAKGSYAVSGYLAAHRRPPENVDVAEWETWFLYEYDAEIWVADGSFPTKDPATIWK